MKYFLMVSNHDIEHINAEKTQSVNFSGPDFKRCLPLLKQIDTHSTSNKRLLSTANVSLTNQHFISASKVLYFSFLIALLMQWISSSAVGLCSAAGAYSCQ